MVPLLLDMLGEWLTRIGVYRFAGIFEQLNFRVFCAAILSFLTVLLLGKRVIRYLVLKKIGDTGQFDHAQLNEKMGAKANTPTMGGVLIAGAIAGATLIFGDLSNTYLQMGLIVLVWHAVVGGVDDWLKLTAATRPGSGRQGLFSWEKLVFQLGIGLLVGFFAYRAGAVDLSQGAGDLERLPSVVHFPFLKVFEHAKGEVVAGLWYLSLPMYVLLMTLFMAGMSNAVNLTDGMDGLASGIAVSVSVGLVILAIIVGSFDEAQRLLVPYVPGSDELAVIAGALGGACLGFLWWNCSPASVFMGDTGSLCIGGTIGYIAVVIRMEYVVILMCAVYLWEILSVVIQVGYYKWTKGKRVFLCAPYHHHLHFKGWPEQRIVARFWILTVLMTAIALASLKVR